MQRVLLVAAILGPRVTSGAADESHEDRTSLSNKLLLFAKKNFTTEKCHNTVDEVHKNGKYTEESITPICEREMKWEKCDFFSEALSLSSSHPDFNETQFCNNMDQAHFCSSSMDNLLMSLPVSDLAYGQCTRAKPKKSDAYCKKFQRMFAYAVQSEDLDTIRACYMIQAYSNMTASQKELEDEPEEKPKEEPKPVTPPPGNRIITSSGKELDAAGKGKPHGGEHRTPEGVTKFGDHGIVVQPQPLEDFGGGKGHFVSPNRSTTVAPAPAPANKSGAAPEEKKTIIVEPVKATEAGGQAFVAQAHATVQLSPEAGARQTAASPANDVVREVVVQIPASDAVQVNGHLQLTPEAVQKLLTLASHGKTVTAQAVPVQSMLTIPAKAASSHAPVPPAQGKALVTQAAPVRLQAMQSSPARVVEVRTKPSVEGPTEALPQSKSSSSATGTKVAQLAAKTSPSSQAAVTHKPLEKVAVLHHAANAKAGVQQTAPVQHSADQHKDRHLANHPSKATALSVTAKTTGKLKKDTKDNYKGFLAGFVDF